MNPLADALVRVAGDLGQLGSRFAIVGGLAVSVRTEPRFTRDVDIAVAVADDREAEEVVRSLLRSGWRMAAQLEQTEAKRLATVRLVRSEEAEAGSIAVDLLFASSGIEPEVAALAERVDVLPGVSLPVARAGHLIALKVLARDDERRPQDASDLAALVRGADEGDLELARRALADVAARGFARGRDLASMLERAVVAYGRKAAGG